jgi:hypothetical protein
MESSALSPDTARAMSQENVDVLKRRGARSTPSRAWRRPWSCWIPRVEWHPAFTALLGGETTVFRGHDGAREVIRQFWEISSETRFEVSEIRDLGDQALAIGRCAPAEPKAARRSNRLGHGWFAVRRAKQLPSGYSPIRRRPLRRRGVRIATPLLWTRIGDIRRDYNHRRRHSALGYQAQAVKAAARPHP